MSEKNEPSIISVSRIERLIYIFRGQRVMLDSDLASLYGVTTKRLNEQVKRNAQRFPEDFMFQLTPEEVQNLNSHIATSNNRHGGRRFAPYAFTEHGTVMLANVLHSEVAVGASIQVVRAFVSLRKMLASNKELTTKLNELEERYDKQFTVVFQAIRELMEPPSRKPRSIGFGKRDTDS